MTERITLPENIERAIRDAFPKSADEILAKIKWNALDDHWYFEIHGMYVGVEKDGYIHS